VGPDVALITYDLRGSGVVRNALRIAARAVQAGLKVELWVVRASGSMAGDVPKGVPLVELGRGPAAQREMDSLRHVRTIRHALRERKPAVFMSAGNQMHIFASMAWSGLRDTSGMRFVGRASNAVQGLRGGATPWRHGLRFFERRQYGRMDRIVPVAEELADQLRVDLGVETARIFTIPNGVDVDHLRQRAGEALEHPWFAAEEPPVLLGVGRLSRQKDFELLIRAFAQARRVRPMRLMILGSGPAAERRRLERLANTLEVAADLELAGFVANPFAYFAQAGLFVLSSRWEGASNVLVESLACGCPVVAVKAPTGIEEVLDGGRFGPIVTSRSVEALAAAIIERLDAPRDAETLVERARDYDLGRTLDAYAELLTNEVALARLSNGGVPVKDAP
jgi:glycosyltransferase involved in cell wall biosynthesis